MQKKSFVVKRPWYGVKQGEVVELAVNENGDLANAILAPNVEPAPEGKDSPKLPPLSTKK